MTQKLLSSKEEIAKILEPSKKEQRNVLTEVESKQILAKLGLPVPAIATAATAEEAVLQANKIGYPVVLKILSPQITHKSDAGCVKVNIKNDDEVLKAYATIMENGRNYDPNAELQGVSVQPFVKSGTEVIVGMKRDEVFGPVLLFGLGGVFVEVVKDFSLRVTPLTRHDISEMIREIKGYPLLTGFRGEKRKDIQVIETIIEKISNLVLEFPEIAEIDLNPIFVYDEGEGASVVDARMILKES